MLQKLLDQRKLPEIPSDREAIKTILQEEIYGFLPLPPDEESFEEVKLIEGRYPEADVKLMQANVRAVSYTHLRPWRRYVRCFHH